MITREVKCTDCDNPRGGGMQTNFLLIHPSHLRDFPHLPTQTTSHELSLWKDSGPYANASKTDIYEKLGLYKKMESWWLF